MKLEFVGLESTDRLKLPGLLYGPDEPTDKAVVWLHGMGDSAVFYKPTLINALGEALTKRGITLLAFNNRGAHNVKRLTSADEALPEEDRSYLGGTHYELIEDCVQDIDGAAHFLKQRGYQELYLAGHSTGANKICAYHFRARQNPFSKYVLAGPGDDVGLFFNDLGEKRYWSALKYAARAVGAGDGLRIMPKYSGLHPFSAQSAYDILNPDGAYNTSPYYEHTTERLGQKRLFDEYRRIDKPTLVIIGEMDEFMATAGGPAAALDILMHYTSNSMLKQTDFQLVSGADHSFHDVETVFAAQLSDWLAS